MGNLNSGELDEQSSFLKDVTVFENKKYSESELARYVSALDGKLTGICEQIDRNSAKNGMGYQREYTGITDGLNSPVTVAALESNRHLNRYVNILAYDANRVAIKEPNEHTHNHDYINASHMRGANGRKYIASQGPIPDSMAGHWQIIWENTVQVVVMVTNEVEGGKLKCHRYWPDQNTRAITYGLIDVVLVKEETNNLYVFREFQIRKNNSQEPPRTVGHFHYTGWPDHGCPETTADLLMFRTAIRNYLFLPACTLVHCSAGVGRTGTYMGLDIFMDHVLSNQIPPILDVVRKMRQDRNFMVQSQPQYVYLYEACRDGMHALLELAKYQRAFLRLNAEQQGEALLKELEIEIKRANDEFDRRVAEEEAILRAEEQLYRDEPEVEELVVHARNAEGKYQDDLATPLKIPISTRSSSLKHYASTEAEHWKTRGNVPLGAQAKGYLNPKAAGIELRLTALANKKRAFQKKQYSEALRLWALTADEYRTYNVDDEHAPLMHRVQGLANAEEQWRQKGDGFRSKPSADIRANLAALTARLGSLAYLVTHGDPRWKARGDGFRTKGSEHEKLRRHTVDKFGSLENRLGLLQLHEEQFMARIQETVYNKDEFLKTIAKDREESERRFDAQLEAENLETKMAELAAQAQTRHEEALMRKAQEDAREAQRREGTRQLFKEMAANPIQVYDPTRERQKKEEHFQAKRADAAASLAAIKAEQNAKAEAEAAKEKQKADAQAQAAKFLKKLK